MSILLVLISVSIAIAVAYLLKEKLKALPIVTWIGWALVGTSIPVLIGQLSAWFLLENLDDVPGSLIQLVLSMGLAAGLGWFAACTSIRLTSAEKNSEKR